MQENLLNSKTKILAWEFHMPWGGRKRKKKKKKKKKKKNLNPTRRPKTFDTEAFTALQNSQKIHQHVYILVEDDL